MPLQAFNRQHVAAGRNPVIGADGRGGVRKQHFVLRRPHAARQARGSERAEFSIRCESAQQSGGNGLSIRDKPHGHREDDARHPVFPGIIDDAAVIGIKGGAAEKQCLDIGAEIEVSLVPGLLESAVEHRLDSRDIFPAHGANADRAGLCRAWCRLTAIAIVHAGVSWNVHLGSPAFMRSYEVNSRVYL
ncbi:hypothetical protein D3C80_1098290 [compost metagenome]